MIDSPKEWWTQLEAKESTSLENSIPIPTPTLELLEKLDAENERLKTELKEKHNTEVKELLCLIHGKEKQFNRAFESEEKEIRHQKYKRCLAMALLSLEKRTHKTVESEEWCIKWYKRWLALADKFKEQK